MDLGIEDEVEFDIHAFELDPNEPKDVTSTTVERFAKNYEDCFPHFYYLLKHYHHLIQSLK